MVEKYFLDNYKFQVKSSVGLPSEDASVEALKVCP